MPGLAIMIALWSGCLLTVALGATLTFYILTLILGG